MASRLPWSKARLALLERLWAATAFSNRSSWGTTSCMEGRHQSQQHCCTSAIHAVERMKMIDCIVAAQMSLCALGHFRLCARCGHAKEDSVQDMDINASILMHCGKAALRIISFSYSHIYVACLAATPLYLSAMSCGHQEVSFEQACLYRRLACHRAHFQNFIQDHLLPDRKRCLLGVLREDFQRGVAPRAKPAHSSEHCNGLLFVITRRRPQTPGKPHMSNSKPRDLFRQT